jgi:peptide/nickel transport system substrate-binding protein
VRHGINYAVDKQLITDQVMLGQAKPLCSIYPETSWVYNPDVPCYKHDAQTAIAQFAKAGYTFQNGQLLDKNGKQLTLKLVYGPNTSKTRELIAVTVQDQLSKIGIKVDIQALEWSSFLQAIQSDKPDWDMFIGGWQATIEPHIMYTIWAKQSIPTLNSVAYTNSTVEDLFELAGATYDTAFRKQKYQQIQQMIAADAPYVFLFYQKAWAGLNKRVQGIKPSALGIGWNSDDWYIAPTK